MHGQDEVLYRDDLARVSRYWLTNEATSFAIRTLIRLTYIERKSPPIRSLLLFFFAVGLLCVSLIYLVREVLPAGVAFALIALSILLLFAAIWHAFLRKPLYLIKATFLDGQEVKIIRRQQKQAHGLKSAIDEAMRFHRYYASPFDEYATESDSDAVELDKVEQKQAVKKKRRLNRTLAVLYGLRD